MSGKEQFIANFFLNSGVNPFLNQNAINNSFPIINNYIQSQTNRIDKNDFDSIAFTLMCQRIKENDEKFFSICNDIIKNVFNSLKIDINITSYDKTYIFKTGNIKVSINAQSGGNFSFGKQQFVFKNSEYSETEGFLLELLDAIIRNSNLIFMPQLKTHIEIFKQKVGESILNGSVAIGIEFGKLIYEFDISKNDDLDKLYGSLTITFELDFDLNKAAEKVGQKLSNILRNVNINITQEQLKIIGVVIIGILYIILGISAASLLLI
jgi:hypothetical protein